MKQFNEIEEVINQTFGEVEQWEHTSNGYWFTFRFEDVFWKMNCDFIQTIKYRLKEIGFEVSAHSYEVLEHNEETEEYTVLHDMEVIF